MKKDILSQIQEIYREILNNKNFVNEQSSKPHLFGGSSCSFRGGPSDHRKLNVTDWTRRNAWDIAGAEGTSVYSIDAGTVQRVTQKPYNKDAGEFGYSVEVQSTNDSIYYTHLSSVGPKIKQGSKIVAGDFIGKIGKPQEDPNWPTHVHIALKNGDIRKLIDGFCNLLSKSQTNVSSSGSTSGDTSTSGDKYFYDNKGFANMVLGSGYKLQNESKKNIIEVKLLPPVPMKPGFRGNFGEKRAYGAHPGTDIGVPSGTQVKAPLSGKVVYVHSNEYPCGGTIDIDYGNGFWSRFCHMKQINVKKGDVVERGDVVGLSGGGSDDYGRGRSTGPHLHFTLKKDGVKVDPVNFIDKYDVSEFGFDKNSSGETEADYSSAISAISNSSKSTPESKFFYDNKDWGQFLAKPLKSLQSETEMTEEKVYDTFGKDQKSRYGSITLPKDKNSKIRSAVEGIVVRGKYTPTCANQIVIQHDVDEKNYYLQYCGITKPSVKQGQSISKGTLLGITENDVMIELFDESFNRVYIDSYIKKEIDKTKKLAQKNIKKDPKFFYDNPWGKILGTMISSPLRAFEDKYDESGNLVQKRWSSPTEKEQPTDWLSKGSPTYPKKLKEQVNKIKKIL